MWCITLLSIPGKDLVQIRPHLEEYFIKNLPKELQNNCFCQLTVCKSESQLLSSENLHELCNSTNSFIWSKTWGVHGKTSKDEGKVLWRWATKTHFCIMFPFAYNVSKFIKYIMLLVELSLNVELMSAHLRSFNLIWSHLDSVDVI